MADFIVAVMSHVAECRRKGPVGKIQRGPAVDGVLTEILVTYPRN